MGKDQATYLPQVSNFDLLVSLNPQWKHIKRFEKEKAILSTKTSAEDLASYSAGTVAEALRAKAPTLATIKKYQGPVKLAVILGRLIGDICKLLQINRTISAEAIAGIVPLIYQDYFYLNLAEVKYALLEGARGNYGNNYQRIDLEVLSFWFSEYNIRRTYAAKAKSESKEDAKPTKNVPPPAWFVELVNKQKEKKTFTASYETLKKDKYIFNHWQREYKALSERLAETGEAIPSFESFCKFQYVRLTTKI